MLNGINLTKNSWHRKYYEMFWMQDAPDNLCNYFWVLLFGLLFIPFIGGRAVYGVVADDAKETPKSVKLFFYIASTIIISLLGGGIGLVIGNALFYPIFSLAVVGVITITIVVSIGIGMGLGKIQESEVATIVSETVKAKKNKICPKINWE